MYLISLLCTFVPLILYAILSSVSDRLALLNLPRRGSNYYSGFSIFNTNFTSWAFSWAGWFFYKVSTIKQNLIAEKGTLSYELFLFYSLMFVFYFLGLKLLGSLNSIQLVFIKLVIQFLYLYYIFNGSLSHNNGLGTLSISHLLAHIFSLLQQLRRNPKNGKDFFTICRQIMITVEFTVQFFTFWTGLGYALFLFCMFKSVTFLHDPSWFNLICIRYIISCLGFSFMLVIHVQFKLYRELLIEVIGFDNFNYYVGSNPGSNSYARTVLGCFTAASLTGPLLTLEWYLKGQHAQNVMTNEQQLREKSLKVYEDFCNSHKIKPTSADAAKILGGDSFISSSVPNESSGIISGTVNVMTDKFSQLWSSKKD